MSSRRFWSIQVAGFFISLAAAMAVVWLLSHWYRRNGFSDQMLLLGSVFLVFALDSSHEYQLGELGCVWGRPAGLCRHHWAVAGILSHGASCLIRRLLPAF